LPYSLDKIDFVGSFRSVGFGQHAGGGHEADASSR
jgi:hypothetical protein